MGRFVLLSVVVAGALGAAGCRSPGERLSESECEELVAHLSTVLPSTDARDALDKCISGETWNRVGYECAMEAGFRAALSSCLMKQR